MGERAGASPEITGFTGLTEVGRGGFATVYRAQDTVRGGWYALKVFDAGDTEGRRISREASALKVLTGIPGIVPVLATTTAADGRAVMVMPFMPGTLAAHASGDGVDPEVGVRWLEEMAAALDRAQLAGVYHRDIKPANVLLDADGHAHLTDFGIAAVAELDPGTTTALAFSPPYAAPERLDGHESDPRYGDIYALAATTWAVIAGGAPFGTASTGGVNGLIQRIMANELRRPERLPDGLYEVLRRGMALDPGSRYGTAGEMAAAARAALGSPKDPTVARLVPPPPPPTDDSTVIGKGVAAAGAGAAPISAVPVAAAADGAGPEPGDQPPAGDGTDDDGGAAENRRRGRRLVAALAAAVVLLLGGVAAAALGGGNDRVDASASSTSAQRDRTSRPPATVAGATETAETTAAPGPTDTTDPAAITTTPGTTALPGAIGSGDPGATTAPGGAPGGATVGTPTAPDPAPSPAPTPTAAPTPTTARSAPPTTAPPVPASCSLTGGRANLSPGIAAFVEEYQSAFFESPVSCQLSNGATLGGTLRAGADFAKLGFSGGTGTGTGVIAWADGRSTNLTTSALVEPKGFDVYDLTLTFTFTSGFGAPGTGTTGTMAVVASFDPAVSRVTAITGIAGTFTWRR